MTGDAGFPSVVGFLHAWLDDYRWGSEPPPLRFPGLQAETCEKRYSRRNTGQSGRGSASCRQTGEE